MVTCLFCKRECKDELTPMVQVQFVNLEYLANSGERKKFPPHHFCSSNCMTKQALAALAEDVIPVLRPDLSPWIPILNQIKDQL